MYWVTTQRDNYDLHKKNIIKIVKRKAQACCVFIQFMCDVCTQHYIIPAVIRCNP